VAGIRFGLLLLVAATAASGTAVAEVVARDPGGFVVVHELSLKATPESAFEALTEGVSAWWDANHSYSGDAGNFTLPARAGGCFCEQLPNGGSVEHMRVVFASPGKRLRLAGGLGPLQGMGVSGVMSFDLSAEGEGARLEFRYTVSGFTPDGLGALAEPVDQTLGGQLARLAAYLEKGDPAP